MSIDAIHQEEKNLEVSFDSCVGLQLLRAIPNDAREGLVSTKYVIGDVDLAGIQDFLPLGGLIRIVNFELGFHQSSSGTIPNEKIRHLLAAFRGFWQFFYAKP